MESASETEQKVTRSPVGARQGERPAARNPYEQAARARKVLAIVANLPVGETAEENGKIADWLAALPQEERNTLAHAAGVNPPSETTWNEVVQVQRWRRPNNNDTGKE